MPAVGVHPSSAEVTLQARGDARDNHFVANVKFRDACSGLLDHADAFVTKNASIGHSREISLQMELLLRKFATLVLVSSSSAVAIG